MSRDATRALRLLLQPPFLRQVDGSVAIHPDVDRDVIRYVTEAYRALAADPADHVYGLLYPALSEDPFEALELDTSSERTAALTGPADVVLATVGDELIDEDTFDAWLKTFGNARRLFRELASGDGRYERPSEVANAVYVGLLSTLPPPQL